DRVGSRTTRSPYGRVRVRPTGFGPTPTNQTGSRCIRALATAPRRVRLLRRRSVDPCLRRPPDLRRARRGRVPFVLRLRLSRLRVRYPSSPVSGRPGRFLAGYVLEKVAHREADVVDVVSPRRTER